MPSRRAADDGLVRAIWDQPEDWLQMVGAPSPLATLWSAQAAGEVAAAGSIDRLAGGEHDRRSVAARRVERTPPTSDAGRAGDAAVPCGDGAQRCVVYRLQRMVSHR